MAKRRKRTYTKSCRALITKECGCYYRNLRLKKEDRKLPSLGRQSQSIMRTTLTRRLSYVENRIGNIIR